MRGMKYEDIKPYIEKKLVSEQVHPEDENVRIFNYTQECQFSQSWDDITRQCRGLILNVTTGEVIARPFPKFFNYGEHVSKGWAIPTSKPEVFEKLDGSLGILYELNGKQWIATRGSFTSDQAQWATAWWRDNIKDFQLTKGITHLFEIIYPQNRIVVNYDYSGLVYLASIDMATGRTAFKDFIPAAVRRCKLIEYTDMETLQKMDEPNSEGFVLFYPEENVRMKIKFPEYVRLHKLVTGLSEIAVWEHLRNKQSLNELVEKVPDEFFKWVADVSRRLTDSFEEIMDSAQNICDKVKELPTRKDQAFNIQKMTDIYTGIVFSLLDGQTEKAHFQAWKMVRPHGARSYKVDIDS